MTIAEVGKQYALTPDTLRYYERISLIPGVGRTSGGIRDYSDEDCRWIEFIKCMRGAGIPIEALREYVSLYQQGESTHEARKQILADERAQLKARMDEMQKTLDRLNKKIEAYESAVIPAEIELKEMRGNS
jgi:DNA-binding transcriptional MerR regulator